MSATVSIRAWWLLSTLLHLGLAVGLGALVGQHAAWPLAVAAIFPLLLLLPGLLLARLHAGSRASLITVFYAPMLLGEAYMQPSQRTALVALAAVAACAFCAVVLWVKGAKRLAASTAPSA